MNVTGAGNNVLTHRAIVGQTVSRPADQRTTATSNTPAQSAPPIRPTDALASGLSVQAPEGTDPELWSILTHEERTYFSRIALDGPLTYSKVMTRGRADGGSGGSGVTGAIAARNGAPIARGGRIDIRA